MIVSCKDRKFDLTISAPPSKSVYHRELIVRFLCGDKENISENPLDNDDICATKACLRALACAGDKGEVILPCNESGSTLRFMIPVAAAFLLRGEERRDITIVFETKGRLFDRPLDELTKALNEHGVVVEKDAATRTIRVSGAMTSGEYTIDGGVSSQYISGLLMALPLFDEECSINVTGEAKSVGYIGLTLNALCKYGCNVSCDNNVYKTDNPGYGNKPEGKVEVEGDWSNGAFLLCLAQAAYGRIDVKGLNDESAQGDKAIKNFLRECKLNEGAKVEFDCKDIPDIVPYMAINAAFLFEKAVFNGIGRLRIKESDRVKAIREQLAAIGVRTEETEDTLTVYEYDEGLYKTGQSGDEPISISSYHDHRMAMTAILIAAWLEAEVDIDDTDCINKSFPELLGIIGKEMKP